MRRSCQFFESCKLITDDGEELIVSDEWLEWMLNAYVNCKLIKREYEKLFPIWESLKDYRTEFK